jgi:hypothetical protein
MARTLSLEMIAALDKADLKKVDEHSFSVAVRTYAEARRWTVWYTRVSAKKGADGQWRGVSPKGEPDLRMVRVRVDMPMAPIHYPSLPREVIFAELKTEQGRPTPAQEDALLRLGPYGRLWRPHDAKQIMEELGA